MPRVSIGMPVRNGARFLRTTLDALLTQTFSDFELVISDNASTDGTDAICREYAACDTRIRYSQSPRDLGAAHNYNRVFHSATGQYFKWAAADDVCAPEYVAGCVEVLDREPDVILCYARTILIDEHDRVLGKPKDGLHLVSADPVARFLTCVRTIRLCNAVMGLIRSDVLARTSLIGDYPGSDIVLLAELSLHGKFHELPDYLFRRRLHPAAASHHRSTSDQQRFFAPHTEGKISMEAWRHHYQYLLAIGRAPLRVGDRVRLMIAVMRQAISARREFLLEVADATRHLVGRLRRN